MLKNTLKTALYSLFVSKRAGVSKRIGQARSRAFHFYLESVERLYVFVFAAKRMIKVFPL